MDADAMTTAARLRAVPARCSECRTCEMVCSLVHEGVVEPALARLRVERDHFVDRVASIHVCEQCEDAPCLEACPAGAIERDRSTGAPLVDDAACIACEACVDACDAGMIVLLPERRATAFKCDLCDGDPRCVAFCPQRALLYDPGAPG